MRATSSSSRLTRSAAAVSLALVPFLGACAARGPQAGLRAYQSHEYELAVESWTPAAEEGDPTSQFCLATMYEEGRGVEVDYALAHEYYLRAASQGFVDAQVNLGHMYARGLGVEPSFDRARVWFERASEQGSAAAQRNLGVMYLKGYGVDQDVEVARAAFEAASKEDPFSARILAALQEEGAVEASPEIGAEWLAAAACGGDVAAQAKLGTQLLQRGEETLAARWLGEAAEGGHAEAQLLYGWMLPSGRGVERDAEAATIWIATAAAAGDPAARASVAFAIVASAGRSPSAEDARDAAHWMHAAAEAGIPAAQHNMGLMTVRGLGVERSYREGVRWFQRAAASGFEPSRERLDELGEHVPPVRG
ncbi:MAG: SEL1-like repeat protein [Planctomycetota bacterium]